MPSDDPDLAVLQHGDEWVHARTGERLATGRSRTEKTIADVLDPDAYSLEWTCPVCGETWLGDEIDHDDAEFDRDGTDTFHVPCSRSE